MKERNPMETRDFPNQKPEGELRDWTEGSGLIIWDKNSQDLPKALNDIYDLCEDDEMTRRLRYSTGKDFSWIRGQLEQLRRTPEQKYTPEQKKLDEWLVKRQDIARDIIIFVCVSPEKRQNMKETGVVPPMGTYSSRDLGLPEEFE